MSSLTHFPRDRLFATPKADRSHRRPLLETLEERVHLSTTVPTSITLGPASPIAGAKTQTIPVSITLPPESVTNKVDIALRRPS
jgi:hypothetical protein